MVECPKDRQRYEKTRLGGFQSDQCHRCSKMASLHSSVIENGFSFSFGVSIILGMPKVGTLHRIVRHYTQSEKAGSLQKTLVNLPSKRISPRLAHHLLLYKIRKRHKPPKQHLTPTNNQTPYYQTSCYTPSTSFPAKTSITEQNRNRVPTTSEIQPYQRHG